MKIQLAVHHDSNHEGNVLTLSARTVHPSSEKVWDLQRWVRGTAHTDAPSSHLPGVLRHCWDHTLMKLLGRVGWMPGGLPASWCFMMGDFSNMVENCSFERASTNQLMTEIHLSTISGGIHEDFGNSSFKWNPWMMPFSSVVGLESFA